MEQGSNEWLEWRRHGIGASESAALLGVCPYKTAFQLYKEKSGAGAEDTEAAPGLFQRGHETEALVRATLELETGVEYAPALFEHPEFPFIRASLDGWGPEGAEPRGIEIKMVGEDAMQGAIPAHHQIQMQHQMLVTATDSWLYLRHSKGVTQKMVVKADPRIQTNILSACWEFWQRLQDGVAPAYQARDWVPVSDDNLDLALEMMKEQNTTAKRAPYRAEALTLAAKHKVNRVDTKLARISIDPPRITFKKEADK